MALRKRFYRALGLMAFLAASGAASCAFCAPDWFLSPPKDNVHLFGAGEGATRKEAERHALSEIAERLYVSVSSEFSTSASQSIAGDKSTFESSSRKRITTKSLPIDFVAYSTIQSEEDAGKIYVLVAVDRFAQAEKVGVDVKRAMGRVSELDSAFELEKSPLRKAKSLAASIKTLEEIRPKALLKDALEGSGAPLYASVSEMASQRQKRLYETISTISASIKGDAESQRFRDILSTRLSDEGFRLTPEPCLDISCVKFLVTAKSRKTEEDGAVKVKTEYNIEVTDPDGAALTGSYFSSTGASFAGEEEAAGKALEKAREQVYASSLAEILGL